VTEKIDPLRLEDCGPEAILKLKEYTAKAMRDVWWTWPEAIAWIGTQEYQAIASLRYWGDWWQNAEGNQLAGQADLAKRFCALPQQFEASLMRALEEGTINSSGRPKPDGKLALLEPGAWRGGAIIFAHGTTCLVSNRNLSSAPWAFDIAVNRADLVAWSGNEENPTAARQETYSERAPSTKAGRAPSDDEILAKADEMKARKLDGRTIAKKMRHEPGFANVATTTVRDLTKGRWPIGRPKKNV
jgi:hypothetical protein